MFVAATVPGSPAGRASAAAPTPRRAPDGSQAARTLNRLIALIDEQLSRQVDAILHHPRFQRLESAWRGAAFLVERARLDDERIRVRLLNVRWDELARDAERSLEFDQTALFRKVYDEEFGMPGGVPFSVLIGDYEIHHRPSAAHDVDDLALLARIAESAAAAFAPFITGLHPSFLGLDHFAQLERGIDLDRLLRGPEYAAWQRFRRLEDSRYVGLVVPRLLMRRPHRQHVAVARRHFCPGCGARFESRTAGECTCGAAIDPARGGALRVERRAFCYDESAGEDRAHYLWGNGAYGLAAVLMRAFSECAWFADIRGFQRGVDTGGLLVPPVVDEFGLDQPGVAPKMSADVHIDDWMEKSIAEQGLIPLCQLAGTSFCTFFSNRSAHLPAAYTTAAATLNERLSGMLQYTLCVGRFAHYLKIMVRDWVGSTPEADVLETRLLEWINRYVTPDSVASQEVRARYPLREAAVEIRPVPGRPGVFQCITRLRPHYQLDDVFVSVRIRTTLRAAGAVA